MRTNNIRKPFQAIILVISILIGFIAIIPFCLESEASEQTATLSVPKTLKGWISSAEHHQWDYQYDLSKKTISITDRFIDPTGDWGDGYPLDYADDIDGLIWDGLLKDNVLLQLTFNSIEGFNDGILFASHPLIKNGTITKINVDGVGKKTYTYPDIQDEDYFLKKRFTFDASNGKLTHYKEATEYWKGEPTEYTDTYYEYDKSGRIIKIWNVYDNVGSPFESTVTISYSSDTIKVVSNGPYQDRTWDGTISNNRVIKASFQEEWQTPEPEKCELKFTYDGNSNLIKVVGDATYYSSDFDSIQYNGNRIIGFLSDYGYDVDGEPIINSYEYVSYQSVASGETQNGEEQKTNPYNPQKDAWGFVNGYEGFGYGSNYMIPVERYEKVFGKRYVVAATTGYNPNTQKTTFNSMIDEHWGGNCYGMSATSIMFYLNELEWQNYNRLYDNDFAVLNNYYTTQRGNDFLKINAYSMSDKETPVTNLIESYQILNYGVGLQSLNGQYVIDNTSIKDIEDYFSFDETEEGSLKVKENGKLIEKTGIKAAHLKNGKYIEKVLRRIRTSEVPLLLNIFYMSNGSVGGHTMVTRTDLAPQQENDGWWKIYLYDPNHPFFPESLKNQGYSGDSYYVKNDKDICFIELNPSENKWRYYGSENNATSSNYHGTDKDGNVKYLLNTLTSSDEKADNIDFAPEFMFVVDISDGVMPTRFDGSDNYWEGADGKTKASTSIYVAPNSSFELYDDKDTLLCVSVEGNVSVKADCSYFPKTGEAESEGESQGGIVITSSHNLVAKNVSGDDISFVDGDSVISIGPDDSVLSVDLKMDNNEVTITCEKSGDVLSQITDLTPANSEPISVSGQGEMGKSSVINYRLEDEKLSANGEISGNGTVDYYLRVGNAQTAKEVGSISSDNNALSIDNIQAMNGGIIKGKDGKWAMYKDGKVDTSYTGIAQNQFGWWRIKDGYVDFNAQGIYQNQFGWWKTTNGKVTFKEAGVFQNEFGWWRVKDSKVDFKAQGIYQNRHGWWKTTNGKVTFKEDGVFQNEFGWWIVKDSKVDFSFTGIASNKFGKWYIKDGKVDFAKNGKVKHNGATYTIKNGKVV